MLSRFLSKPPLQVMAVAFLLFLVLSLLFGGNGLSDTYKILFTVTSFLFGLYSTSLIGQSRTRHSKIVEGLREEGGNIKAIYYMTSGVFPKSVVDGERSAIDEYLMAGMDFRTADYAKSAPNFQKLFDYLMKIKAEDKQQDVAWSNTVRIMSDISKNRNRIEAHVKERISAFEWMTTATLLLLVIFFVYSLNTGSFVSVLITSFVSTALAMLLVILHNLDSLQWKEEQLFWTPIEELFTGLDLLPYYPKILFDVGRIKLKHGSTVRLAEYPNQYPDISDKTITIRK